MDKTEFYKIIDRADLQHTIQEYNTPCYIYFLDLVKQKCNALRQCLNSWFTIHYAVKANPHSTILQTMAAQGIGADVASMGELKAALNNKIQPSEIEFSGPGKAETELRYAIQQNIGSINVESLAEIEKIIEISKETNNKPNVGIRINPDLGQFKSGLKMAGETQFGIPEEQVDYVIKLLLSHSDLITFTGIHVHTSSQILDGSTLVNIIHHVMDIALTLENRHHIVMQKINFGGGWGITYFENQTGLDMDLIASELNLLFQNPKYKTIPERTQLIIEPGRFLVGESGIYVTKVLYRKSIRGKEFAIVDGGMHHNYLLAGGMGQVIRRNFEMDVLSPLKPTPIKNRTYQIAGKLCTPQDILAFNFKNHYEINVGDYIIFYNCGAYGPTASPVNFLSHPPPQEIFIP